LEEKIKELFAAVLEIQVEKIVDLSTPGTIENWDSLNHLNLIAAFEQEFSIDIEPEEIPEMMKNFKAFKLIILSKL
jgi:acyl carrier protein